MVAMLADHIYLGEVWIGASAGKWRWADGQPVEYTAWSIYNNQPLVESAQKGCAELSSSETNYHWVSRDCQAQLGKSTFVCRRPATEPVVAQQSAVKSVQQRKS